jgi:hypothetical protein
MAVVEVSLDSYPGFVEPEQAAAQESFERALVEGWYCDERKIMWGGVLKGRDEYMRLNVVNDEHISTQLEVASLDGSPIRLEPRENLMQFVHRRDREKHALSVIQYSHKLGTCVLRTYSEPWEPQPVEGMMGTLTSAWAPTFRTEPVYVD